MEISLFMKKSGFFFNSFFQNPLFLYVLKCLVGVSLGYALYIFFPEHQFIWTMISTLIVLTPENNDVHHLALDRIKANIIGSSIGLLIFFLHSPDLMSLFLGITGIIILCSVLKHIHAARTALVAFLIVILHENRTNSWRGATERMGCVITGCVIAIIVTFIFSRLFSKKQPQGIGEESPDILGME